MKYHAFAMALAAILFVVPSGFCEDVVAMEWGGPWTGHEPLFEESSKKVVTPGFHTFAYDDTLSWRPQAIGAGEGVGDFFVAISSSVGGSPAVPHILRLDSYRGRALAQIIVKGSQQNPPKMRGMFFLTGAQFAGAKPQTTWRLSESSVLSFSGIIDGMVSEARWLIRDGQTWYVSEAVLTPQQDYNKVEARELANPGSIRWSEYPADSIPLEKTPSNFTAHAFEDITAMGVFWDSYDSSTDVGGTSFTRFAVESLTLQSYK